MELREHPVMICDGVRIWPPKWWQTYGPSTASVSGEVGKLETVFLSEAQFNKVYLSMHTENGNRYLGFLIFEKADSAKTVFEFLNKQVNKSLTTIGAMDFSENFVILKLSVRIPLQVYSDFLGRLTLESRESAALKTAVIESEPLGDYTVDILCNQQDGLLLLSRAKEFYPDAIPYIQTALDSVPR